MSPSRSEAPPEAPQRTPDGPLRPADHADTAASEITQPTLGFVGWMRWGWRQLTSMRTALVLLLLLAIAAVPGSLVPQRSADPNGVTQYYTDNPELAPVLDGLQLFDVYTSVWFSAIYLLLFISLIGCVIPRTKHHAKALRARPPRTPARLARLDDHVQRTVALTPGADVDAAADEAIDLAADQLRRAGYRVERYDGGAVRSVSAERGYLRETGNLLFHTALVGVLVCLVVGDFTHYRGQAVVVEGRGFANSRLAYDSFEAGRGFRPESLVPFRITLDRFESTFDPATLLARDFTAEVTVDEPGRDERAGTIKVNHPLSVGGAKIYLMGNGYAPQIEVHDAAGELAFSGPVPFLPQDTVYSSQGVVKVPDVTSGPQIGLVGYLLPTAVEEPAGFWRSVHPLPLDPALVLSVWTGDLGLDAGLPQNVYELDEEGMTQVTEQTAAGERPRTVVVRPGQTVDLPEGLGTVTLGEELPRFVALDLRHDPTLTVILVFALAAILGLGLSLFTPRRRVWVRARHTSEGTTVVEVAALARGDDPGLEAEVDSVRLAIAGQEEER